MEILGTINKDKKDLNLFIDLDNVSNLKVNKNYAFSDKNIFIHIDGVVTKLSDKITSLTKDLLSLEEKIAFLFSTNFDIESHICGSFNIFLFDHTNKKLKIIRDTRGTRSLFYANNEKDFLFSSDLNSIIGGIKEVTLNKDKLIEFLNWDYKSNNETYFNEIYRLEPSHYLTFSNNVMISREYSLSNGIFHTDMNKDVKETFKKTLYKSVIGMTDRKKRIGIMMSGGLDSSAIAISLKKNNYKNVKTYSANFDHLRNNGGIDEMPYQKNVSKVTSYPHFFVQMKGKSPIAPIQHFTKILCQPILFPNIYIFEEIAEKLKKDKIEVILDGNDGDNTISHGFEVLFSYFIKFRFIKFTREVYLYSKFVDGSFKKFLFLFIKQAIKEIFKIKKVENKTSILKKNLKIKKNPNNVISFFSSHRKKLSIDLHFQANEIRNEFFRHFKIENFSPFYDEELINFCISMPSENKFKDGLTRNILREFLLDFLPKNHAQRDKSILTPGLLSNFTDSDLKIFKSELKNINKHLLDVLDLEKLESILCRVEKENKITEEELINIQVFISANVFLNQNNL
tara:strand:- start:183 stop:1886 length:1704 start_codon:yes stop_codon:yes gene_type:complete